MTRFVFPALLVSAALLSGCGAPGTSSSTASTTPTATRDLLSFSTSTLDSAYLGETYSMTISPLGGTSPYSVRLVSGKLPEGLTFSGGASATLSGTPKAVGSSSFRLEVSDANLSVRSADFTLTVTDLPALDLTPSLPTGEIRGETRVPLKVVGPRGLRAARMVWLLPEGLQVTQVQPTGGNDAGRPLVVWKQRGRTLMADFGFRLTPKNGAQVALLTLRPSAAQGVTISAFVPGTTSFLVAMDGAGKVLREVKTAEQQAADAAKAGTTGQPSLSQPVTGQPAAASPAAGQPATPAAQPAAQPSRPPATTPPASAPALPASPVPGSGK